MTQEKEKHIHIAGLYAIIAALITALASLFIHFDSKSKYIDMYNKNDLIDKNTNRVNHIDNNLNKQDIENMQMEKPVNPKAKENLLDGENSQNNDKAKTAEEKITELESPSNSPIKKGNSIKIENPGSPLMKGRIYHVFHAMSSNPENGICGLAFRTRPLTVEELYALNKCQSSGKARVKCQKIDNETYTGVCIEHGRQVKYLGTEGSYYKILDIITGEKGYISKKYANQNTLY